MSWKIIQVDNYDREGPGHDDRLVANIQSETTARQIVKLLNDDVDPRSEIYYQVVPSDYKLRVFE